MMSGWSRVRREGSDRTGEGEATDSSSRRGGRGNAAANERLFAERDYGILSQQRTQRAIDHNNNRALDDLAGILGAFHLAPRDAYDAEVINRIAEFQQNFGRRENAGAVDGMVGSATLTLLESYYSTRSAGEVDTSSLWPSASATVDDQFDHFARMVSLFGHDITEGEPFLIGIRGVLEFSDVSHEQQSINAYDDTFVLLLRTREGKGVWTFAGATHAYQAASGLSPNADGRGRGDVGSVRPTHGGESYMLEQRGDYHGRTSMGLRSEPTEWGADQAPGGWALGHVPMHRDTNHDRSMSAGEQTASEGRTTRAGGGHDRDRQIYNGVGDYGTVVWMHPGFTESKANGSPFASIGCLTAREEDLINIDAVSQQADSDIRLVVVEAEEAAGRMSRGR
jgi:hypothetical protein